MTDQPFIVTTEYGARLARDLATRISSPNSSPFYLFASDHRSAGSPLPADLTLSADDAYYAPWQQMVFGARVTQALPCVRNSPYLVGTVYPQWDDRVDMTAGSPWYAVVNSGSFSHVFACLYNSSNSPSTVQPDFSQVVGGSSALYQTSDGYRWKYVYSVDSSTVRTYATVDWFPFVANSVVSSQAVAGSVDVVSVEYAGRLYDNYTSGTFQASDVRVNSVSTLYQLSNSTISSANGFYQGCTLLITGGVGAGQYALIQSYVSSNGGNFATIDAPFVVTPQNGSQFSVLPTVNLVSDGTETVPCSAVALVNALASNSVSSVQVLRPGAGYFGPTTASVFATPVVGVSSPAVVRPVMPPRGGHGYDAANELSASTLVVSCTLANTQGNTVPATGSYRQVGILRSPAWANVQLTLLAGDGSYLSGEPVTVLRPLAAETGCSIVAGDPAVTGPNTALFGNTVVSGQQVFVSNGTAQFLANVASVQNSTVVELATPSPFSSANVTLYSPNRVANGVLTIPVTQTNVYVTSLSGPVSVGDVLFGLSSGVGAPVSGVTRNDVAKPFDTFVQLWKYRVTVLGGSFIPNEYVLQGNASALVHSYSNGYLFVSNQSRPFVVGTNLTGNTSGTVASPTAAYSPELVPGSGSIEYVENATPVTRQANQSEQWIVAFELGS